MTPDLPRVYRLVGRDPKGSGLGGRQHSQFVGRGSDVAALDSLLARAMAGTGQAAVLRWEPGIGKSRLLVEFRQHARAVACRWLEGRCVTTGTATPYGPLVHALFQALDLREDDDPEVLAARTEVRLMRAGLDDERHVPYLGALLGVTGADETALRHLSPEAIRFRTFEALHQLFSSLSVAGPLVVAIEDVHWIDPTSEAYLAELVDRLAAMHILLVATSRPGPSPSWLGRSHASQLALAPLTSADSVAVVRSIASPERLSNGAAASIAAKADGNPFFLEELCWAALTAGEAAIGGTAPPSVAEVLRAASTAFPRRPSRF